MKNYPKYSEEIDCNFSRLSYKDYRVVYFNNFPCDKPFVMFSIEKNMHPWQRSLCIYLDDFSIKENTLQVHKDDIDVLLSLVVELKSDLLKLWDLHIYSDYAMEVRKNIKNKVIIWNEKHY